MSDDAVGEVWFYTSYMDVFIPIDLSYEDLIRGLESRSEMTHIVDGMVDIFSQMIGREERPKVKWAYLDLNEREGQIVIRCRMEYTEEGIFWSGDTYLFGLRAPSPTYAENVERLSKILRRHRNILVLPGEMLRLPRDRWGFRSGVGIDRSYRD